jgi:hypothetical protein|tara:strand:- start:704 stop:1009 length:306 start_codon:yes stop_codon:yes gene_type:complete
MDYFEKGNKSNSNTLGISGAYVTNWPEEPKIGNVKPKTIVTRLARGSEAEQSLLHCAMNNYSYGDYVNAWSVLTSSGAMLGFHKYLAIKAEVMEVVEESFK